MDTRFALASLLVLALGCRPSPEPSPLPASPSARALPFLAQSGAEPLGTVSTPDGRTVPVPPFIPSDSVEDKHWPPVVHALQLAGGEVYVHQHESYSGQSECRLYRDGRWVSPAGGCLWAEPALPGGFYPSPLGGDVFEVSVSTEGMAEVWLGRYAAKTGFRTLFHASLCRTGQLASGLSGDGQALLLLSNFDLEQGCEPTADYSGKPAFSYRWSPERGLVRR